MLKKKKKKGDKYFPNQSHKATQKKDTKSAKPESATCDCMFVWSYLW